MNWELFFQLLLNGVIVGMLYGVVAMCFVLIYKSTQVVNFAQGEFLVLGAWVCLTLIVNAQLPFIFAFLFSLAFMAVFGIVLQMVILRPLIGEPIISVTKTFPDVFGSLPTVNIGGLNIEMAYVMSFFLSIIIMLTFFYFFKFTRHGLAMRATAYNQQVAQSLGISVKKTFAMAWAISAVVSGVSGVVMGLVGAVSNSLAFIGIKVFTVAPFYVLILILMIKPYGLFGTEDIERV